MKHRIIPLALTLTLSLTPCVGAQVVRTDQPRVTVDAIVATEQNGFVFVEAEKFFRQTNTAIRAWHITDASRQPSVGRDIDPPNHATASGGAYIEVLPDEGNDGTPPVKSLSISDVPGEMAVIAWRVQFTTPGRYYIWSRAFGTDGDDNTLHYGLNDAWPDTSARSHTFGGKKWQWANRHRQHKGKIYFDIPSAGVHVITASMREDGCELDQFVLTTDESWTPPEDHGYVTPPKRVRGAPRPPMTEAERMQNLVPPGPADTPLVTTDTTFEEQDGQVVIEAEHYTRQTSDMIRRWYLNSAKHTPTTRPDPDPVMVTDASNGTYVEVLPDTFVNQGDRPIDGINYTSTPGAMAVLHYPVHFTTPGRYYLWTRMRSNDDEDNTLNAGLDDTWPASTRCLQFPKLQKVWWWGGVIRDPRGPDFPHHRAYLDIPAAGVYTVMYSMREDGMEFDKFLLTMDGRMKTPEAAGPAASPFKTGGLAK